ncbi:MAG: hypothetical protein FJ096_14635, partial [Deltaproteobacteria bacterium]|nr:hypothetical protein [Deltaproteobacteria bacterium]
MTHERRVTPRALFAVAAVAFVGASIGSGGCAEERLAPAPTGTAGVGGSNSPTSSSGGGGEPVRRTVTTRNPFGNVAVSDNLLWDGDFEWLSSFADQYAWL